MNCRILRSLEKHTVQKRSPIQPIGILLGWSSWLLEFVKDLLFLAANDEALTFDVCAFRFCS